MNHLIVDGQLVLNNVITDEIVNHHNEMTKKLAKKWLPYITAWVEGKTVQYRNPNNDEWFDLEQGSNDWFIHSADSNDACREYRIKPSPTLRPWRPEEVPVGAWIRNKTAHETGYTDFASIIGVTAKSFYTVEDVFEDMEISLEKSIKYVYSLDHGKTWLPCGVVE